jgi:uncharacterized cupin superfamily protein
MQKTIVDGVRMWSAWQPQPNVFFNSYFIESDEGNLVTDPLPLYDADAGEIEERGGIAWVVLTNRDHERSARELAQRFGAKIAASAADAPLLSGPIDRMLADGETIGDASVLTFEGLKTPGEIALHFPKKHAAIVGDALWGDVAGSLRLGPKLADPAKAALSLRRLAAVRPEHLLLGDGQSIFGGAQRAIWTCLEASADVYVNKANADELPWSVDPPTVRQPYECAWLDIDFFIGAEKLGYRVARLAPGKAFCPLHWHSAEEELFVVLEGEPTLVTSRGNWKLRKGDYVAFPTRASGAHKVVNESSGPCEILMVSNVEPNEACHYPDSQKILVDPEGLILRDHPVLDYYDGE